MEGRAGVVNSGRYDQTVDCFAAKGVMNKRHMDDTPVACI